jgi:hypothetical protein
MTAKIKLNAASGGGSFSLQAPSSSSNNRVITLPDIADGTLVTSQSTLDSTKLSPAITAGITEMDNWRIYSSATLSGVSFLTSNWERNDTTFQKIGTGLTESSGVFSFPSTGKYYIVFFMSWNSSTTGNFSGGYIRVTTDGSNYTRRADGFGDIQGSGGHTAVALHLMLDIENISTHKIKFEVEAQNSCQLRADSGRNVTGFISMKLGDT